MVFKLSGNPKYCFCVVASPPKPCQPSGQMFLPWTHRGGAPVPLQHSSSWYICSSSSWDSRCSRRSVRPLIISSGVFMNLQNRETSVFPSGLSFYLHQDIEAPRLYSSPNHLCCILPKLSIPQHLPSLLVSSFLHTLKGNQKNHRHLPLLFESPNLNQSP